jgi:hypothetical protein
MIDEIQNQYLTPIEDQVTMEIISNSKNKLLRRINIVEVIH